MKTNMFCKLISLLLVLTLILPLVGCDSNDGPGGETQPSGDVAEMLEYTDTVFFADGQSEYTLLTSDSSSSETGMIRAEMAELFPLMSGCELITVTSEQAYSESAKYISVGNTSFAQSTDIINDAEKLGVSGYRIKTYGNSIVIWGNTEYAALCGLYDFLGRLFGYKAYAMDEVAYETKTESMLPDLDVEVIPSIDRRICASSTVNRSEKYRLRLRQESWGDMFLPIGNQSMATVFALLPKETYYEDHPEWYNQDGNDMCYTNTEMRDQMIENLKPYILQNPEYDHVMIGQEDGCSWCNCENCQKVINEYGGFNIATSLIMVNYMEEQINAWLKEIGDPRTMKLGLFSYQVTIAPPAVQENGEWKPLLKTNPNVFIMHAPIDVDYYYAFDTPENQQGTDNMKGWGVCTEILYTWTYSVDFHDYMVDYPIWEALPDSYKKYPKWNVKLNFPQGAYGSSQKTVAFDALKAFLLAELAFDCNADYEKLIDDFFVNYYKDASEPIHRIFSELRDLEAYNVLVNDFDGNYYTDRTKAELWPRNTLMRWEGYIEEAYQAIEHLQESDPNLYETLYWRINLESMTVQYLLIELHGSTFSDAELLERKLAFKSDAIHHELVYRDEWTNITELYKEWGIA